MKPIFVLPFLMFLSVVCVEGAKEKQKKFKLKIKPAIQELDYYGHQGMRHNASTQIRYDVNVQCTDCDGALRTIYESLTLYSNIGAKFVLPAHCDPHKQMHIQVKGGVAADWVRKANVAGKVMSKSVSLSQGSLSKIELTLVEDRINGGNHYLVA